MVGATEEGQEALLVLRHGPLEMKMCQFTKGVVTNWMAEAQMAKLLKTLP